MEANEINVTNYAVCFYSRSTVEHLTSIRNPIQTSMVWKFSCLHFFAIVFDVCSFFHETIFHQPNSNSSCIQYFCFVLWLFAYFPNPPQFSHILRFYTICRGKVRNKFSVLFVFVIALFDYLFRLLFAVAKIELNVLSIYAKHTCTNTHPYEKETNYADT